MSIEDGLTGAWIDENFHVTFSPDAKDYPAEEIKAAIEAARAECVRKSVERDAAQKALEGLPYAAVPVEQLADIYERFLRLLRLGSLPLDEWEGMPEAEVKVRREIFRHSDFGAVFAGQWLPKDVRAATREKARQPDPDAQDDDGF